MFLEITDLVNQLNALDLDKIEKGHYPTCKNGRLICQKLKTAAQDAREDLNAYRKGEKTAPIPRPVAEEKQEQVTTAVDNLYDDKQESNE